MSTPSRSESADDLKGKAQPAERITLAITMSVLRELGRPLDLLRVAVVPLWGNHYRVNVQTGQDVVSARVAHSFFLKADDTGAVLASTPAITRLY